MKKVIILFLTVFVFAFCSINAFAEEPNYPVINLGMGTNLLDPNYLYIEGGDLEYRAWIPLEENQDYCLFFNNMEWEEDNVTVYIEFDDGAVESYSKHDQIEPIFYLTFKGIKGIENKKYFRISATQGVYFSDLERLKKSVTIFYSGGEEYYQPYFYDENYKEKDDYVLVTTPDYKLDLDYILSKFKAIDEYSNPKLELVDDGGYNENYMKTGTYNVTVKAYNSASYNLASFKILVFEMDVPIIEGPDKLEYAITDCFPSASTGLEWFRSIYKFTYGSRNVSIDYVLKDKDNKQVLLGDISNIPGTYKLTINGIYNGNIVVYKEVELIIDVDIYPDVFYPNFMINLSSTTNATNEQLENYLNQLLKYQGLLVDNVSIISNSYQGNEKVEGVYEIIYEYEIDGHAYISKASINVNKNNKNDINNSSDSIVIKSDDNKMVEYISMCIIGLIILLMVSYYCIEKYKNRKKSI